MNRFISFPDIGVIIPVDDVRDITAHVAFHHELGLVRPANGEDAFKLEDTITARVETRLRRHSATALSVGTIGEAIQHAPSSNEDAPDDGTAQDDGGIDGEGQEDGADATSDDDAGTEAEDLGIVLSRTEVAFSRGVEPLQTSDLFLKQLDDDQRGAIERFTEAYLRFLAREDKFQQRLAREEAGEEHPAGEPAVNVTEDERQKAQQRLDNMSSRVAGFSYTEESSPLYDVLEVLATDPSMLETANRLRTAVKDEFKRIANMLS